METVPILPICLLEARRRLRLSSTYSLDLVCLRMGGLRLMYPDAYPAPVVNRTNNAMTAAAGRLFQKRFDGGGGH